MSSSVSTRRVIEYDDHHVRLFVLAGIFWGLIGMVVGVLIAFQLNFSFLNLNMSWLSFGRLRPLHTNGAIFAFVGNMLFAGIYHSTQRLCKVRTANDLLTKIHFWGWQVIIVGAAITLPLGLTQGKEYAELIWPLDILVAVIWVIFGINFFWTLAKRNEPTLYVAIWFYIATIITVAMLYVVNNLALPTSLVHSYPIFGGVKDALIQWWYGHNAVAFFLTTPILGIMYYYIPKAANRPVYSYRLSVVHFWSLVFIYIWAGPHHLLNTSLPHWLQALGMLFSLMLWAPSWGGMLNGLLTLRGAWDQLRRDPVLKFFAAGVTFYGMATFEGPLLSIRAVNYLSHYTDWTIGHVHSGTLGWNGFMAAGMFYYLAPRLWKTKLYSVSLANMHFWIGTVGILLYVASMWASGITQGLMLNGAVENGTVLAYPNFLDTLNSIRPLMLTRAIGGTLYLVGWVMLMYNIYKTVAGKEPVNGTITVEVEEQEETRELEGSIGLLGTIFNWPVFYSSAVIVGMCLWFFGNDLLLLLGIITTILFCLIGIVHFQATSAKWSDWYERLLGNWAPFSILVLVAVAIGGMIQIIPTIVVQNAANLEDRVQVPYTPLELAGRNIYISEGCYNCHSQQIRMMMPDVLRYGDYSRLGESIYDHPFQWGSKRTGPDLAREGGKRPNVWHYDHMNKPTDISPGSNMPPYPAMLEKSVDWSRIPGKVAAMRTLGVPYPDWSDEEVLALVSEQANEIVADLEANFRSTEPDRQIVALIAYLQKLGTYEDASLAAARLDQ
ncbi:cytochrome-c oxidase, cbb3-type subunit I [Puniceicoccales bacterium CK1056]|uniref:cytochrome-c oxidase n=1 Tax=Oceanipulchritudo coccoides TaxID=2706888 RepID=A0A6B2LXV9_9BACT|nr:cytochrome-c oxidase, cbb3-type subunit I [Oceanipulchritudo coccoides]NDV60866.1 cytochrome-c oxidase, cbb3-type subunit I [Oceanipulchritudo coccoides]